jgi:tetratricopeptide (TPR) repeat protein
MSGDDSLFERVGALQDWAWALQADGRLEEAHVACMKAFALLAGAGLGDTPDAANILADAADVQRDRGYVRDALAHAQRARSIVAPWAETPPRASRHDVDADRLLRRVLTCCGTLRRMLGEYGAADWDLTLAAGAAMRTYGLESAELAESRNELAVLYKFAGRFAEAERLYALVLPVVERVSGAASLEVAAIWHNVGGVLHAQGLYARAEQPGRKAWELSRALLGDAHPRVAADACAYAAILFGLERLEESERLYRDALAVYATSGEQSAAEIAAVLHDLAAVRDARGDFDEAAALYRRALELREAQVGPASIDVALTRNNLGELLVRREQWEEAEALLQAAHGVVVERLAAEHPSRKRVAQNLAAARRRERG